MVWGLKSVNVDRTHLKIGRVLGLDPKSPDIVIRIRAQTIGRVQDQKRELVAFSTINPQRRPNPAEVQGKRKSRTGVLPAICRPRIIQSRIAATNASGSKGWRSSMPSPTPKYRSGRPVSWATARAMPPLAVPSNLVRMMPVTPMAS